MTAAGTIRPATVLVLGAGVAGLQAIATARRLGAVVQGFDVRAAVKEQVESLGASFLEFDLGGDLEGEGGYAKELTPEQQARQQELMAEAIGRVDVVITTALVPGRRAPILVTEDAVKRMKPGSVVVDLDNSLARLFEFLRIQSISTDPAYAPHCRKAAEFVAKDLAGLGFDASIRPTEGHPVVVGKSNGGGGPEGQLPPLTQLRGPRGVCFSRTGTLYIVDTSNHRVLRISPALNVGETEVDRAADLLDQAFTAAAATR